MRNGTNLCGVIRSLPISAINRAAFWSLIRWPFGAIIRPGELVLMPRTRFACSMSRKPRDTLGFCRLPELWSPNSLWLPGRWAA